jgi:acyl-CoA synthetase (AMP-forming)/AMP-acid ligase II
LQDPDLPRFDTSRIRRLFYGSAPMDVERIRQAMHAFPGADLQQGYGLTETSPILTTLDPEEHVEALKTGDLERLRSCGRAVIATEITIRDDEGNVVPVGATGEVVVRGPQVTKGYLNRPVENGKAFRNGWFHTGDVGRMDAEGFLYLLDRKKDMIVSGGENVYCAEVESALYQHADVSECAVFGVPDEHWGEAVAAAIVPAPGAPPTVDEIIAHCRNHIGGYKIPRRIVFVEALPKTAVGKVQKSELRRLYGEVE